MAKKNKKVEKKASLNIVEYDMEYLLGHMAEYNPRTSDAEQDSGLSYNIEKFGYVENIIFNKRTETLVSGHRRLAVMKEQGVTKIDGQEVDLDIEDEKKLNIIMNSKTIKGDFTWELSDMLSEISESDPEFFDMVNLGGLDFKDMLDDENEYEDEGEVGNQGDDIPEMELMPYEHYDAILVVFRKADDFMFMKTKLKLHEKRVISAPMVKNKKIGYVRAIPAEKLIDLVMKKEEGLDLSLDLS